MTGGRPAVFLDRDGTMSEERGFIDRLELLEIFPWTTDAVRLLNRAGFAVVVITNQSAIGRGIIDESAHRAREIRSATARAPGGSLYFAPHHPDAKCLSTAWPRCRKRLA
jgi:D-glycero-D-manno-heptose 1,7-bisphosphate phosphatase